MLFQSRPCPFWDPELSWERHLGCLGFGLNSTREGSDNDRPGLSLPKVSTIAYRPFRCAIVPMPRPGVDRLADRSKDTELHSTTAINSKKPDVGVIITCYVDRKVCRCDMITPYIFWFTSCVSCWCMDAWVACSCVHCCVVVACTVACTLRGLREDCSSAEESVSIAAWCSECKLHSIISAFKCNVTLATHFLLV